MSWQSPPLGAVHIDYRGSRFLLGRTSDHYAIWDAATGGAPIERYPLSAQGWASAWEAYREREGDTASVQAAQATSWAPSPVATWRRGERLAMAPMRVGEILDGAFKLYRMQFRVLIPIVALVQVPLVFLQFLLLRFTLGAAIGRVERGEFFTQAEATDFLIGTLTSVGIGAVIGFIASGFLTAAMVRAAGEAYLGRDVRIGETMAAALRRTHSVLWVLILIGVAIAACVVPFVLVIAASEAAGDGAGLAVIAVLLFLGFFVFILFLLVRWRFATATVILEERRGSRALGRSWALVRGLGWKVFGTWLLAALLAGLLGAVINLPLQFVSDTQGGIAGPLWYLYPVSGAIGAIITTPFTTLVTVLLYFDARMRKEGFDLEVMADQLRERA